MKKRTHKKQRMKEKHPVLSAECFTILYLILAAVLFFGIAYTKGLSEDEAFVMVCIAAVLYFILMTVRIIRGILTRKRMDGRLSSPERRARLQEIDPDAPALETSNVPEAPVSTPHTKGRNLKRFAFPGICVLIFIGVLALYMNWNSKRIPDSLTELKAKYPETASFVDSYPQNKNKKWTIDLSGEVQPGSIPLFLQWDERWGYETYGSSFLAVTGCGPTCISMVVCGLTGDTYWNPRKTAKFSEQQGYYVPGEGTSWDLMTEGAQMLGLNAFYGDVSADYIYSYLDSSHPIICSMYPGDFTYTGHFIVLTGIDPDGNIIVNDPNSRRNSDTHWTMDTLLPQIRSLWCYAIT